MMCVHGGVGFGTTVAVDTAPAPIPGGPPGSASAPPSSCRRPGSGGGAGCRAVDLVPEGQPVEHGGGVEGRAGRDQLEEPDADVEQALTDLVGALSEDPGRALDLPGVAADPGAPGSGRSLSAVVRRRTSVLRPRRPGRRGRGRCGGSGGRGRRSAVPPPSARRSRPGRPAAGSPAGCRPARGPPARRNPVVPAGGPGAGRGCRRRPSARRPSPRRRTVRPVAAAWTSPRRRGRPGPCGCRGRRWTGSCGRGGCG